MIEWTAASGILGGEIRHLLADAQKVGDLIDGFVLAAARAMNLSLNMGFNEQARDCMLVDKRGMVTRVNVEWTPL